MNQCWTNVFQGVYFKKFGKIQKGEDTALKTETTKDMASQEAHKKGLTTHLLNAEQRLGAHPNNRDPDYVDYSFLKDSNAPMHVRDDLP